MEKDPADWEGWIVPAMKKKGAPGPLTEWPLPWFLGGGGANAPRTATERFKRGDEVIYEMGLEITRGEVNETGGVVEAVTPTSITVKRGGALHVIDWQTGKLWIEGRP